MREGKTLVIKAWMLPLIVVAIAVPITVSMVTVGPALGLAAGAFAAVVIFVIAANLKPDEPIEVASAADRKRRALVVAVTSADDPPVVERIADLLEDDGPAGAEVLVLAPASDTFLDRWATDVRRARDDAQVRLAISLGAFAAARIDAHGKVGDGDPLQATADALRTFPADQVILVTAGPDEDRSGAKLAAELNKSLAIPFRHLVVDGTAAPHGR
jgi:hypothetical protein